MTLAGGVQIEREFDRIRIQPVTPHPEGTAEDRHVVIPGTDPGTGVARIGGRTFAVRWVADTERGNARDQAFDPTELRFPLEIRGWRPGDRIVMPYGTKKVKKLFGEKRVGRGSRARIPVLVDAAGRVLWIVGVARACVATPAPGRSTLVVTVDADAG